MVAGRRGNVEAIDATGQLRAESIPMRFSVASGVYNFWAFTHATSSGELFHIYKTSRHSLQQPRKILRLLLPPSITTATGRPDNPPTHPPQWRKPQKSRNAVPPPSTTHTPSTPLTPPSRSDRPLPRRTPRRLALAQPRQIRQTPRAHNTVLDVALAALDHQPARPRRQIRGHHQEAKKGQADARPARPPAKGARARGGQHG